MTVEIPINPVVFAIGKIIKGQALTYSLPKLALMPLGVGRRRYEKPRINQPIYNTRVFSYREDFHTLWSHVASPDEIEDGQNYVVIADGYPPTKEIGEGNFAKWIPAHSWAVALVAAFMQEKKTCPMIFVLDLSLGGEIDIRSDDGFGESIRCYGQNSQLGGQFFLNAFLADLIKSPKVAFALGAPIASDAMQSAIQKYWNRLCKANSSGSGDSDDQHDVSNQIGAMIMRAGMPRDKRPGWYGNAGLLEKNTALMVERLLAQTESDLPESDGNLDCGFEKHTKIVLVDDHHDEGYRQVLQIALGVDAVICYMGALDDGLTYDAEKPDPSELLGMNLSPPLQLRAFPNIDVLFLDLRLWKGKDNKKTTLDHYLLVAKKLSEGWAGVAKGLKPNFLPLLDQAMNAHSHTGSHRALAMLPLIVSGLDPSLPIILFSSTQHRSVIQAVRGCPNIITDFAKPYIGSDDTDAADPAVVMEGLKLAEGRANEHLKARQVWLEAVDKWKDLGSELRWHEDWPVLKLDQSSDLHPALWLRKDWLPLAQRGEYTLAASLPWLYLTKLLGTTRLEILCKGQERNSVTKQIKLMEETHKQFSLCDMKYIKTEIRLDMAINSAAAIVSVIHAWIPPNEPQ